MPSFPCEKRRNRHHFREPQPFLNHQYLNHATITIRFRSGTVWPWSCNPVILHIAGASTIYSTRHLLHNHYLSDIQLSASTVRSVTVDCNTKDLNAAMVPVEMLQEDIRQTLLPVATVTRLEQMFGSWRIKTSHVLDIVSCTINPMSPGNKSYGDSST